MDKDWCLNMAKMEDGQEISAGARDHPLRLDWKCAAQPAHLPGGGDPQECDWPTCGCDPYATKVIDALIEQGHLQSDHR